MIGDPSKIPDFKLSLLGSIGEFGEGDDGKIKQVIDRLYRDNPILQGGDLRSKISEVTICNKGTFFEVVFDDKYRIILKKTEAEGTFGTELQTSDVVLVEKLRTPSIAKSISHFFRGILAFFYKPYLEMVSPKFSFDERTVDNFQDLMRSLRCGKKWIASTAEKTTEGISALKQIDSTIKNGEKISEVLKQPSSKRKEAFEKLSKQYVSELSSLRPGDSLVIPCGYLSEGRMQPLFLKFFRGIMDPSITLTIYNDQSASDQACEEITHAIDRDSEHILNTFFSSMVDSQEPAKRFEDLLLSAGIKDKSAIGAKSTKPHNAAESAINWIHHLGGSKEENVSLLYRLTEEWVRSATEKLDFLPKNEQKKVIEECLDQINYVSKKIATRVSGNPKKVVPEFLQKQQKSLENRLERIAKREKDPETVSKDLLTACQSGSLENARALLRQLSREVDPSQQLEVMKKALIIGCENDRFDIANAVLGHIRRSSFSDSDITKTIDTFAENIPLPMSPEDMRKLDQWIGRSFSPSEQKSIKLIFQKRLLTELLSACKNGDFQDVRTRLEQVGKLDQSLQELMIKKAFSWGYENNRYDLIYELLDYSQENEALLTALKNQIEKIPDPLMLFLDGTDKHKRTLLGYASEAGNSKIVEILIELGADKHIQDGFGKTPYDYAKDKYIELATRLQIEEDEIGVEEVEIATEGQPEQMAPLIFLDEGTKTVEALSEDKIESFQSKFEDIDNSEKAMIKDKSLGEVVQLIKDGMVSVDTENSSGLTPLQQACEEKNPVFVEDLIEKGADINQEDSRGITPFMYVCASRDFTEEFVGGLIAKAKKIDTIDQRGMTPLQYACQFYRDETVKQLVERGADIHEIDTEGHTPFMYICESKEFDVQFIEKLLPKVTEAKMNEADTDGMTPLLYACQSKRDDVIQLLATRGAHINQGNSDDETPFMYICGSKKFDVAFIEGVLPTADINKTDSEGMSPLLYACQSGSPEVVRLLLEKGANINQRTEPNEYNEKGQGAVELALKYNTQFAEIEKVIKELRPNFMIQALFDDILESFITDDLEMVEYLGAKDLLEVSDENGMTPLMHACALEKEKIVERILEYEPNLYAHDASGKTAYHHAEESGNREIQELLGQKILLNAIVEGVLLDVEKLIDDGVIGIDTPLRDDKTAVMLATDARDIRIMRYLAGVGAYLDPEFEQVLEQLEEEERLFIDEFKQAAIALDDGIKNVFQRAIEGKFPVEQMWAVVVQELENEDPVGYRFAQKIKNKFDALQSVEAGLNPYEMLKICAIAECMLESTITDAVRLSKLDEGLSSSLFVDFKNKSYTLLVGPKVGEGATAKVKAAIEVAMNDLEDITVTHVVQKVTRKGEMISDRELKYERIYGGLRTWVNYSKGNELKTAYTMESFSSDLLAVAENQSLTLPERLKLLDDIAKTLERMHDDGVVHGDIKLENGLFRMVGDSVEGRLADFGHTCKPSHTEEMGIVLNYGTDVYNSPELKNDKDSSREWTEAEYKAWDMYAFGCMMAELLIPEVIQGQADKWYEQNKDAVLSTPPTVEQLRNKCICAMLNPDPVTRMTIKECRAELQKLQNMIQEA